MASNFQPKLLSARPRVSAALQAATVKPFANQNPPAQDGHARQSNPKPPKQKSSIAIALRRAF